MTDVLFELLISRRDRKIDLLYRALIIVAIILLAFSTVFIGSFGLLLAIIVGVVAYYVIFPRFSVEYEYTLFNKELDIDVIYKKETRKSAMSLDLTKAELIAPLSSPRMASYQELRKIDYSANDVANPPYAIVISHKEKKVCVLIQMNDALYSQLEMVVPRIIYKD